MLKIGEFAQLGQVSIATLRHYDQFGLLKPSALDPCTGYRYYSLAQLPRLHRIVTLKDLGFPLHQIAQLLEDNLSLEQLQTLFRLKQAHIQQVIDMEQARLTRVAARLQQIEQEGSMPAHEMLLKLVDPLLVAAIRKNVSVGDDLTQSYEALFRYTDQHGLPRTHPRLLLWYSRFEVRDNGVYADVELAIPVRTALPANEQVNVRTLPGGLMACTVHSGYALSLGQAHIALHRWLSENKYRLIGPPRQVHLQLAEPTNPGYAITEIQFPVEKQST